MSASQPVIEFWADRTVVRPGEQTTLHWRVEGVKAVYVFREDKPWQEHGVAGHGERQVSPPKTSTFRMRVVKADDSVEVRNIEIQVRAEGPAQLLAVDRTEIGPGECVTIRWHVEGIKAVYFFPEGERWQEHGVVGVGEQQVCPSQTTTYRLRIIKPDDTAEVHKIEVRVQGQGQVQPFAADRTDIKRGECVTFRWHVERVKAVYFFREGKPWQEHGVVGVGEKQVCPSENATFCLRVVKANDAVDVHYITIQVRG